MGNIEKSIMEVEIGLPMEYRIACDWCFISLATNQTRHFKVDCPVVVFSERSHVMNKI